MGKSNGTTRASASSAPRGLTASQQNIVNVNNAVFSQNNVLSTRGTSVPTYQDTDEWKSENVDRIFSEAVTEINRTLRESGDRIAYAQVSWDEYGDRAIRILNGGRGTSGVPSPAGKAINDLSERLVTQLGVPRRDISTSVQNTRGAGTVYYLSFKGWKGRK